MKFGDGYIRTSVVLGVLPDDGWRIGMDVDLQVVDQHGQVIE